MARLLVALKRNRHGQRDWLIGLLIYRHGLRVSEACDLRWDDIDLPKRTIIVRRLKGSTDSTHYLSATYGAPVRPRASSPTMCSSMSAASRSGAWALRARSNMPARPPGCHSRYTFTCCGTLPAMPWRRRAWMPAGCNTSWAMPASPIRFVTPQCRPNRSRTCGAARARHNRPQNAADALEHAGWSHAPLLCSRPHRRAGGGHRCV
jgi:Phage integrase family